MWEKKKRNFPFRVFPPPLHLHHVHDFYTSSFNEVSRHQRVQLPTTISRKAQSVACVAGTKKGGGEGEKSVKRKNGEARRLHRGMKKSTSESTIPEKTTYRIDYMSKVTSCFGSSKFLMTFRFVAQPKNFHLTATYVYIDFISRLLPTYPGCQRLFMLGFWFRSSLSKDPRERHRRTGFGRGFVRHQSITP